MSPQVGGDLKGCPYRTLNHLQYRSDEAATSTLRQVVFATTVHMGTQTVKTHSDTRALTQETTPHSNQGRCGLIDDELQGIHLLLN